jgi:hypothetical protein
MSRQQASQHFSQSALQLSAKGITNPPAQRAAPKSNPSVLRTAPLRGEPGEPRLVLGWFSLVFISLSRVPLSPCLLLLFTLHSLLFTLSFAQEAPAPLTLPQALSTSNNRSAVINAQLALNDATLALTRTQADPLALRLQNVQAQQKVSLTQAQLDQAKYQAIADIAGGYTQLLEAQSGRDLSSFARDLSNQSLQITQIRRDKGSATDLEVQEAQNALEDAENNLLSTDQAVAGLSA